jgi:hypothetical protein
MTSLDNKRARIGKPAQQSLMIVSALAGGSLGEHGMSGF